MTRSTVSFDDTLYNVIKGRAAHNCRSVSKEVTFLLEAALAAEMEGNLEILRMLMHAQGGPQAANVGSSNAEH